MPDKSANPFFPFDMTGMVERMMGPGGFDMATVVDRQQRAFDAMVEANRTAFEGYQSVMMRQMDIMRESLDQTTKAVGEMSRHTNPGDATTAQIELARGALERAYSSMQEITAMTTEANQGAFRAFQSRFSEIFKDVMPDGPFTGASNGASPAGDGAQPQTGSPAAAPSAQPVDPMASAPVSDPNTNNSVG